MSDQVMKEETWPTFKKVGFRFALVFFLLYIFPFPLDQIPYLDIVSQWWFDLWDLIIPSIGKNALFLDYAITVRPNGSGDTTWNYVQIFSFLVISLIATFLWSLLDRKRVNYVYLKNWLLLLLRYYLAITMFSYGFYKVFKLQFSFPYLTKLIQPIGESSPMGLAWAYMGYSSVYNLFTGLTEVVAGFLLIHRKTSTFGALLTGIVMYNVFMMNVCFDIPVKLFSGFLFMAAIYIASSDLKRIISVFFKNYGTSPISEPVYFKSSLSKRIFKWMLIVFPLFCIYQILSSDLKQIRQPWADSGKKPDLFGIYNVAEFRINGKVIPPLLTDTVRWKRIVVDAWGNTIISMNDHYSPLKISFYDKTKTVTLQYYDMPSDSSNLLYRNFNKDSLVISGIFKKDTLLISCIKFDLNRFTLVNRGFQWINEYPYNR